MIVVATAGHVDHGKSTLIRALTGMEPDRWAEERRRGLTIDLGFAWTTLPGGARVAFVDVPGHQRFVGNMLAGVGPVPAVLFVVAADEGWRAQSQEHLDALDALGVRHGILVVTRADLGGAERAAAEAHRHLAGSSLAGLPTVAVSAVTGAGLDELRQQLDALATALPRPPDGPARLWIDRVFTRPGVGTVVTGTLRSGILRVGDEVEVLPSGIRLRVRSLESLKRAEAQVEAVARVAVGLRGPHRADLGRGDALTAPARFAPVSVLDVRLTRIPDSVPAELMLHVGSAAVAARVRRLGQDLARLTLVRPLPLHVGERAVLREPGAHRIVAGVVVLDTRPPTLDRRGAARQRAEELGAVNGEPDPPGEIRRRGADTRSALVRAGVLNPDAPAPPGVVEHGDWLIDPATWARWSAGLRSAVDTRAADDPVRPALPGPAAARQLALPDVALLRPLVHQDAGLVLDGDGVHRADRAPTLPPAAEAALGVLLERLRDDPFAAPDAPDLDVAGLDERQLAAAVRTGRLLRIAPGLYLRPDAIDAAAARLAGLPQPFTMSQARQALGTTRRVAVPLLELLDREHRTARVDSQRRRLLGAAEPG